MSPSLTGLSGHVRDEEAWAQTQFLLPCLSHDLIPSFQVTFPRGHFRLLPSLPPLPGGILTELSHRQAYGANWRVALSRGAWPRLAVWPPAPTPHLECGHCCAASRPRGRRGGDGCILGKGVATALALALPQGPGASVPGAGEGGGSLGRQRLGLCSLSLPSASAGEACGARLAAGPSKAE